MLPTLAFRTLGIDIKIHWTWWLLALFYLSSDLIAMHWLVVLQGCWFIFSLMYIVLGHELAHAKVAKHYGVNTKVIYLHLLGGTALLESMNFKPKETFWVALAGPLSNFAFALGIFLLLFLMAPWMSWLTAFPMLIAAWNIFVKAVSIPFAINIVLGVFNLLPAYPMDGGRVLLASLQMLGLRLPKALTITYYFAMTFGVAFVIVGAYLLQPMWVIMGLMLVGINYYARKTNRMI